MYYYNFEFENLHTLYILNDYVNNNYIYIYNPNMFCMFEYLYLLNTSLGSYNYKSFSKTKN